jgi:hypothetical protein
VNNQDTEGVEPLLAGYQGRLIHEKSTAQGFVCSRGCDRTTVQIAGGGAAIQLTHNNAALPQESADGSRVFYVESFARLMSVSANGGDEREITGVDVSLDSDNWTPAKNGIYFINGRTIPISLKLLNVGTGRVRKIADLPGQLRVWGSSPSVSADGHTLIFAINSQMTGDITVVQSFR